MFRPRSRSLLQNGVIETVVPPQTPFDTNGNGDTIMTVLNAQTTHDAANGDATRFLTSAPQALPQASGNRFPSIDAILHDLDATFDTQRLAA